MVFSGYKNTVSLLNVIMFFIKSFFYFYGNSMMRIKGLVQRCVYCFCVVVFVCFGGFLSRIVATLISIVIPIIHPFINLMNYFSSRKQIF